MRVYSWEGVLTDEAVVLTRPEEEGMEEVKEFIISSWGPGTLSIQTRLIPGGTQTKGHTALTGDGAIISGNFYEITLTMVGTGDVAVHGYDE